MTIRPIGDNIVIKLIENSDTTAAGIVLPGKAADKPQRGEVVSVGPGKALKEGGRSSMEVSVGEQVLFRGFGLDEYDVDGQKVAVIAMSDVIAVIE